MFAERDRTSRTRTSERLLTKLTVAGQDGAPRIVDQPPLVTHVDIDRWRTELEDSYRSYLGSLSHERSTLVSRFRAVDFAMKVVGVGSVGILCFIALLLDDTDSPLFLQVKEAQPSVLTVAPGAPSVDHGVPASSTGSGFCKRHPISSWVGRAGWRANSTFASCRT